MSRAYQARQDARTALAATAPASRHSHVRKLHLVSTVASV